MFELFIPVAYVSIFTVVTLLSVFALSDIRTRRVTNTQMIMGIFVGTTSIVLSGHLLLYPVNHVMAILIVTPIAYLLWRMGSIGGADVKCLLLVAIVSPGIELVELQSPLFEVIVGNLLQILLMLATGYLYQQFVHIRSSTTITVRPTPLIPFLLFAYLVTQMLALL